MRWGAVTSADDRSVPGAVPQRCRGRGLPAGAVATGASVASHQPLLADDVGLGKTIEAGLVVQELLLRHRARTAIVVCPPSLSLKWQDEMREKFGLDFAIVNSDLMARRPAPARPAREPVPAVPAGDREHGVAAERAGSAAAAGRVRPGGKHEGRPPVRLRHPDRRRGAPRRAGQPVGDRGRRGYAVDTQRTIAVRELADKCEHRLFLSATPHNGLPGVVHRADGDDRLTPVQPRRRSWTRRR